MNGTGLNWFSVGLFFAWMVDEVAAKGVNLSAVVFALIAEANLLIIWAKWRRAA